MSYIVTVESRPMHVLLRQIYDKDDGTARADFSNPDDGTLTPDDECALLDILTDYMDSAVG